MKKLLVVTGLVLSSIVSFGQDISYQIYKKINLLKSQSENFTGVITVKDNVVEYKEMGLTKVYEIDVKTVTDNHVYCKIKNIGNVESEFIIEGDKGTVSYNEGIKTLDGKILVSRVIYVFKPLLKNKVDEDISEGGIGTISGIGNGYNYGGWISFGKFGVEYVYGAGLSNDSPNNYINGRASSYTAGFSYMNFGVNYYYSEFFIGGGLQKINDITTSGIKSNSSPYFNFGINHTFGKEKLYVVRGELMAGKVSSVNVGVGINF